MDRTCPRCGKDTLVRKKEGDKYMIVCTNCGLSRGEFKPDERKGVV